MGNIERDSLIIIAKSPSRYTLIAFITAMERMVLKTPLYSHTTVTLRYSTRDHPIHLSPVVALDVNRTLGSALPQRANVLRFRVVLCAA